MYRTDRKEFSNDPTVDIAEISSICEQKMTLIQKSLDSFLKSVALEDEQKKVNNCVFAVYWMTLDAHHRENGVRFLPLLSHSTRTTTLA